jgi:hypothetical protein
MTQVTKRCEQEHKWQNWSDQFVVGARTIGIK